MKIKEINISDNNVIEVFNSIQQVKDSVLGWLDTYKTICADLDDMETIYILDEYEKKLLNIESEKINLRDLNEDIEFLIYKKYVFVL